MSWELEITLGAMAVDFDISLDVNIEVGAGECPLITEIDGGNSGNDSQFTPINGNLDGGGA
jgi:hypothetical protein